MAMRQVLIERDFEAWRETARRLLAADVRPEQVIWAEAGAENPLVPLAAAVKDDEGVGDGFAAALSVPRSFVETAWLVACHRDAGRWPLLYRVLWRLTHGEKHLLDLASDEDVVRLGEMERQVRFDRHKMTAFVRFRKVIGDDGRECFVARYRPEHFVVRFAAPFFARRFAVLDWSILTPDECAHWDSAARRLTFTPGASVAEAPAGDELESLWLTYYAHIFNPARVKVKAMK
jgi:DNA polymerase